MQSKRERERWKKERERERGGNRDVAVGRSKQRPACQLCAVALRSPTDALAQAERPPLDASRSVIGAAGGRGAERREKKEFPFFSKES